MSQPLPPETIEYEPGRAMPVIDDGPFTRDVIKELQYSLNASYYDARAVAGQIYGLVRKHLKQKQSATEKPTITIRIEGGMVQDVTGIPPGVEVRVDDYDHPDETQPTWDSRKECHVTVYDGGRV